MLFFEDALFFLNLDQAVCTVNPAANGGTTGSPFSLDKSISGFISSPSICLAGSPAHGEPCYYPWWSKGVQCLSDWWYQGSEICSFSSCDAKPSNTMIPLYR
ncbi:hypothetical protein PVAP13_9NG430242 [Panicum virgatum]|uniref:Uncharacterized protein n=1 Tax=Panicum virgatum TaxID=38727 RepID=A0A8T0MNZ6_PANVG|nr:hypothetical protein PVAP13_9NG430242 [Panicum virgatum]